MIRSGGGGMRHVSFGARRALLPYSLIYSSRPTRDLSDYDLVRIWEISARNNEALDVTSALFFSGEVFFHVLEGEALLIDSLFEIIKTDGRHRDIEVLAEHDVPSPAFRGWPMKFIDGRRSDGLRARFDPEVLTECPVSHVNALTLQLVTV
ncbi:MAG: BLUF domain-containing protein [Paracoccaceae bacterium]